VSDQYGGWDEACPISTGGGGGGGWGSAARARCGTRGFPPRGGRGGGAGAGARGALLPRRAGRTSRESSPSVLLDGAKTMLPAPRAAAPARTPDSKHAAAATACASLPPARPLPHPQSARPRPALRKVGATPCHGPSRVWCCGSLLDGPGPVGPFRAQVRATEPQARDTWDACTRCSELGLEPRPALACAHTLGSVCGASQGGQPQQASTAGARIRARTAERSLMRGIRPSTTMLLAGYSRRCSGAETSAR